MIANFGAGYNNLDTKMLKGKGIKVSNTPNVLNDACANHALLLILAVARSFTDGRLLILLFSIHTLFIQILVCMFTKKKNSELWIFLGESIV